jgi:hypothetical protein
MALKQYTAIIFIQDREYPIKYRKIINLQRFMIFAVSKYPYCTAVNFYDRQTKQFYKQLKP